MAELDVRTIPGYLVHERLEVSTVDVTYLASRISDGYPVTLQILTEEFSDTAAATTLRSAIDQIATIRHPVIPTVWDVGEADGQLYTISTAIEGRPLAATLAEQRHLSHDQTLAICTELADALETLAVAGIAHGALSPHTVWINDRDRSPSAPYVSLRGFGTTPLLARSVRTDRQQPPPSDVLYAAPEQIDGGQATDRSDQYALAAMVLHGLTGTPLFDSPTLDALFAAHLSQVPDDEQLHAGELPEQLVDGLRRALAKDPADRFDNSMTFTIAIGGAGHGSWTPAFDAPAAGRNALSSAPHARDGGLSDDADQPRHNVAWPLDNPQDAAGRPVPGSDAARPRADGDRTSYAAAQARQRSTDDRSGPVASRSRARGVAPGRWRRWVGAALVLVAVVAAAAAFVPTLLSPPSTTPDDNVAGQLENPAMGEIEATWSHPVANMPMTHIETADEELIGAGGTRVASVNQETGQQEWATTVGAEVTDLLVTGPMVIARTGDGFVGLDVSNGEQRWRSADTGLPEIDAFVAGRARMFGAGPADDVGVAVHAIDPTTGEVGWSIDIPEADAGGEPIGLAYDSSESGRRSLYVTAGDELFAYDTTTREQRWTVDVRGAQAASLTASGGAALVVNADGWLCRYDGSDGSQAWPKCATLERAGTPVSLVEVAGDQVGVATTREILAVDLEDGETRWRVTPEQDLQPAMEAGDAAIVIADSDGIVEDLAQQDGAPQWASAPFGDVNAICATDRTVFVATAGGQLARLDDPADES